MVAAAILGVQATLFAWATWRRGRPLLAAWRTARGASGPLVVLEDDRPAAFALPGWPGRIVTTDSLLASLTPAERRVVVADEQAHLDGRHDLHATGAAVCAAIDPLLGRLPAAVGLATERWADERAARSVGERRLVAATIARVAARCTPVTSRAELRFHVDGSVLVRRVESLLRRPPRFRVAVGLLAGLLSVLSVGAAAGAAVQTNTVFQKAEQAFVSAAVQGGAASAGTVR